MLARTLAFFALASYAQAGGNVTAYIDADENLVVIGDAADNGLSLDGEDGFPQLRPGASTLLNGSSAPLVLPRYPGLRGKFLFDLGDGDDSLNITITLPFAGTVIRTGNGDDWITFFDSTSRGPFILDMGFGNDLFRTFDSSFDSALRVNLGPGNDALDFGCGNLEDGGTLRGLGGFDTIWFYPCDIIGAVKIVGFEENR